MTDSVATSFPHTVEVLRGYLKLEPQQLEALRTKGVV
ncbi:hypothetical protein LMG23994_06743 [Cupriavidus pinatubonensis]|uniref:Uncharacterized protein n=1 Tax=Cupriavidus pinatubonensis TaxID=248026 RepID=A0ABM8Y3F4_9BURK|nr:hypothetical protein LMG23994_06743 [Cupriavidus pinatubonensis]